ncbi:MAG: EAL domain-containing protein [Thermoanaerobaculia bacterium]|nr:EAL domain-containing protein [Thermoanaerobaculia bacterium]
MIGSMVRDGISWPRGPTSPKREDALENDPIVFLSVVVLVLVSVPYFFPIFGPESQSLYGAVFVNLPLLAVVFLAFLYRLGAVVDLGERRFWKLLTASYVFWTAELLLRWILGAIEVPTVNIKLMSSSLLALSYLAIAIALEGRPHIAPERTGNRLRALDRIGAFVFILGLFLYFAIVPGLLDPDGSFSPSILLYLTLDIYLSIRLSSLLRSTSDFTWRSVYKWLLVTVLWWSFCDLITMLMWSHAVANLDLGTVVDVLWLPPFLTIVIAARARDYGLGERRRRTRNGFESRVLGPLVLYAVTFPLLHVTIYRFGLGDQSLRSSLDALVVVFAGVLAAMALGYQELLRAENRRLALEQKETNLNLEHQAYHDGLTGLPNRHLFADHLELAMAHARRSENRCAVIFLDLDRFKVINDSQGHEAGDELLKSVAIRLKSRVRESDTIARFGGDEFIVLVGGIENPVHAGRLAGNLLESLSAPFQLEGIEHVLSSSIGISIFPDDGESSGTLLKNADIAMYQAKLAGRNTYRLFTEEMNTVAEEWLEIESGLRKALERREIEVFYQPILEVVSGFISGCEALVRWRHPVRGLLGPESFIETAEQTGLIVPIGYWVLEAACTEAAAWREIVDQPITVAVNLSPRQFQEPQTVSRVASIVERSGLPMELLQLEITESMAINEKATTPVLEALSELGARIAIDDFGTGYSSLGRLRDMPIDTVKIDRSFIRGARDDPKRAALVGSMVGIARALGLSVVAEGVEDEGDLEVVRTHQCDLAQGFLFHRPMPAEQFRELLAELEKRSQE